MKMIKKWVSVFLLLCLAVTAAEAQEGTLEKAYYAGGCFWGVEYYLESQQGVREVTSGFMGGFTKDPTYKEVVYTNTGHIETVEVVYDPSKISYEALTKLFFEIHDFTQVGGQGPDIGERYESYIFYASPEEKKIAQALIALLKKKGYKVATRLRQATPFYKAESYHQDYYRRHNKTPYCHAYTKIF